MAQEAQDIGSVVTSSRPQPFVKWVGGKTQILKELLYHVPEKISMYHEPMVGGGALFWSLVRSGRLRGSRVALGDTNGPLMACYRAIRDNPDLVINELEQLADIYSQDGGSLFYRIRDAWNEGYTTPARFIFLKQTSFNGLWRYNQMGRINMPWGKYDSPKILDAENIRACSQALQGVGAWFSPFEVSFQMVARGDVVYVDPPYCGRFDLYGPDGFSSEQHVRLVQGCAELSRNGVHVIYTNEESDVVLEMLETHWPDCRAQTVESRRFVNRDGGGRGPVVDLIVSSRMK